jgi:TolB-like protein/Flp pilus assembly protein TadD
MTPERWKLVEDLYHRACELSPGSRLAFLEDACADDAPLIAEVISLLRANGPAERLLETPAMHVVAQSIASGVASATASLAPGSRLSHYRIHEAIGRGGMGVVYKAEDVKLERLVALKVLPDFLSRDEEALRRFEREARAASALNHPNICTVYEIDQSADQRFIAIEFLEGESLRDRIARGPINPAEILRIGTEVCSALEAAHAGGIVHRDIKPANIFLTKQGITKVLDFGAAKRINAGLIDAQPDVLGRGRDTADSIPATQSLAIGTLAYMSPEQGSGLPADPRSDVYSLGAVLYEMATGRLPVEAEPVPGSGTAHVRRDLEALVKLEPAVPAALSAVVAKALREERSNRYQSIAEMRADLMLLQHKRVAGRSWKIPALAAAVVAVVAATLIAVFNYSFGRSDVKSASTLAAPRPIKSLAILPFRNSTGESSLEYFADGMTEALIDDLSSLGTIRIVSSNSSARYKDTKKSVMDVARELKADALVEGSVDRSGRRVLVNAQLIDGENAQYLWHAQYERDIKDVLGLQRELAVAVTREAVGDKSGPVESKFAARTRTVNPDAYEAYLKAEYFSAKQTPTGYAKADEYYLKSIALDPQFAPAYTGQAETLAFQAYTNRLPPLATWERAEELLARALELDPDSSLAHTLKGMIALMPHCDRVSAEKELTRALQLSPGDAATLTYHSWYLMQTGRTSDAIEEKKRVLEADPVSVITGSEYGMYLSLAGRQEEAIQQLNRMLELDPEFAPTLTRLGQAYARQGRFERAVEEFRASVAIDESSIALGDLGYTYARWREPHEALAIVRQMRKLSERRYMSPTMIARIYAALGDGDRAIDWLNKAGIGDRPFVNDAGFDGLRSDARFRAIAATLRPSEECPLM